MKSETPPASLAAVLCRTHRWKARAQFCVCLPLGASHPEEQTLRSWDRKSPFAHSLPLQHTSTLAPWLQIQLKLTEAMAFNAERKESRPLLPPIPRRAKSRRQVLTIFFLGERKAWHSSAPLSWLWAT